MSFSPGSPAWQPKIPTFDFDRLVLLTGAAAQFDADAQELNRLLKRRCFPEHSSPLKLQAWIYHMFSTASNNQLIAQRLRQQCLQALFSRRKIANIIYARDPSLETYATDIVYSQSADPVDVMELLTQVASVIDAYTCQSLDMFQQTVTQPNGAIDFLSMEFLKELNLWSAYIMQNSHDTEYLAISSSLSIYVAWTFFLYVVPQLDLQQRKSLERVHLMFYRGEKAVFSYPLIPETPSTPAANAQTDNETPKKECASSRSWADECPSDDEQPEMPFSPTEQQNMFVPAEQVAHDTSRAKNAPKAETPTKDGSNNVDRAKKTPTKPNTTHSVPENDTAEWTQIQRKKPPQTKHKTSSFRNNRRAK